MSQKDKTPFLKSWRNVYALVIVVLVLVILSMYFFMQHFK